MMKDDAVVNFSTKTFALLEENERSGYKVIKRVETVHGSMPNA